MHVYKTMSHNKLCIRVAAAASCGTTQSWLWVWWEQGNKETSQGFIWGHCYCTKKSTTSTASASVYICFLGFTEGNLGAMGMKLHTSLHWTYMLLVGVTPLFCFTHFCQSHWPTHQYSLPFRAHSYQGKVMVILVSVFSLASLTHGSLCELLLTRLSRQSEN